MSRQVYSTVMTAENPFSNNFGSLVRKDMRRGRQIALCSHEHGVIATGTIRSSPFDDDPKRPDRETGHNVLVTSDASGQTLTYTLYELGVAPDDKGKWCRAVFLLDANSKRQLAHFGGDVHANDPPDRVLVH